MAAMATNNSTRHYPNQQQSGRGSGRGGGGIKHSFDSYQSHAHHFHQTSHLPPRHQQQLVGGNFPRGGKRGFERDSEHEQQLQHHHRQHPASSAVAMFHQSIIDNEKLKRMDYIETNEDDWTKNDDDFDYSKKLNR